MKKAAKKKLRPKVNVIPPGVVIHQGAAKGVRKWQKEPAGFVSGGCRVVQRRKGAT